MGSCHYFKEGLPCLQNHEKMIELIAILAEDIPFVHADFYEVQGRIFFGELAFYPWPCIEEFTPFDLTGNWFVLPQKGEI